MALIPPGKIEYLNMAAARARITGAAVSVTLAVTPSAPAHGDTVTAVYTVTGNDPGGTTVGSVTGDAVIGGTDYKVSAVISLPGAAALPESFQVPACPGLAFKATAQPNVFTAVVP